MPDDDAETGGGVTDSSGESPAAVSRAAVADALARLRDQFGSFPVAVDTVENDPDYFASGLARVRDGFLGDAGAWVEDDDRRVLLIRHADAPDRWGTPGGGHEPGETLAETARREVREETGVACSLVDVAFARRKRVVDRTDPERRYSLLTVSFVGAYDGVGPSVDAATTDDEEVVAVRWAESLPDATVSFVRDRVAPRVR